MADLVYPIVHSNGTTAQELVDVRIKARYELMEALKAMCHLAPNGRDYYLGGNLTLAIKQHQERMEAIKCIMADLLEEIRAIQAQTN